jgi:hypothetical protein
VSEDRLHNKQPHSLPSFSVIIESENLAVEDSAALFRALATLARQTISIETANEVLLVNSGRIPDDVDRTVQSDYPWLRLHNIGSDSTYYEAKQNPVALTTGEVVVFCDCDCQYSQDWLESLLSPYVDPQINADVVTGETAIDPTGFQGYFLALAWCFPPYSKRSAPYPTNGYAANNVSFRRTLLEEMPIPTDLRLYRGNCSLHAREIIDRSVTIWKSPTARARHPAMRIAHVPARFFMWGHHEAQVCRARHRDKGNPAWRAVRVLAAMTGILARRLAAPFKRWPVLLRQRPASVVYVPPMLCYIALAEILFFVGAVVTLLYPSMSMMKLARSLEASEHG